ncbi:acyl-CoA dehydrogenase family protein [Variovorax boronicumulans]|uniref:acyl-CoA dehydrogenase family protein n=1 Tax=Variovorax boronicumulans TaxID=436515 RepID=UPI0036F1B8D5
MGLDTETHPPPRNAAGTEGKHRMDLTLNPRYEAFRDELRAFLATHGHRSAFARTAERPDADALAWQRLLLDHGYAGRTVPRDYGGHGATPDVMESHLIAEEFARAGAAPPLGNQGISMLVPTLLELGSEAQRREWIGPTLRGEVVWCQGYSEPGAGSDLASLQTRATEDGGDFVINGQKIWTSTAHVADMIFCLVRTEPGAAKHAGISYLLFSMKTPGIEVRPLKTMTGHAEFNEVFFTDVRVPQHQIVGQRGDGWKVANATLKHERGSLGNPNLTTQRYQELATLMQAETVDGTRLIDQPVLRDRLMRLQGQVLAQKCHGLRLLTAAATGEDPGLAALVVKLQGCELRHQLAALAIDALGELGLLMPGSAHLRAQALWQERYMFDLGLIIGGGTAQIQKNIIAERGLDMPREPRLA